MDPAIVPLKTPAGQAELETRRLRLSQRHRTVLLLVDGRRTAAQVRQMAQQAGVTDACFDELIGLGLIAAHAAEGLLITELDRPGPLAAAVPSPGTAREGAQPLRIDEAEPAGQRSRGREGVSVHQGDEADEPEVHDAAFARARDILLRMVKAEAPVTGSLTLLRLRRARSRAELGGLVDEVKSHLGTRQRSLAAAQSLASVRQLLSPSFDSTQPIA